MHVNPRNPLSDLRGASRLAIDAIIGTTELVETVHRTITTVGGLLGDADRQHTKGVTGMVYWNIRTVTGWVGGSIDVLLGQLVPLLGGKDSSSERETVQSILNGIVGDHLVDTANPLAIRMQLRRQGKSLARDDRTLREAIQQSGGKVMLLVHGWCANDLQWDRSGHDHGAALASDLGCVPLYLHYNSGLHISENGSELSELLETFVGEWPELKELTIIAYSMGGLISRSACHYGEVAGHSWLHPLRSLVCIGTPHHGAPLERYGNWIDNVLEITPYSAPFSRLGKIRSAGITDMRYGNLLHDDWNGWDRFALSGDRRRAAPLPNGVQCYAIAATTGRKSSRFRHNVIGDGLVPLDSALGRHKKPDLNLLFPDSHQWIGRNMNHMDLITKPEVYDVIRRWLGSG